MFVFIFIFVFPYIFFSFDGLYGFFRNFFIGAFLLIFFGRLYVSFFGAERVRAVLGNSLLGIFAALSQLDWFLRLFGSGLANFPWYAHIVPVCGWIMIQFLFWQIMLEIDSKKYPEKSVEQIENMYFVWFMSIYGGLWLVRHLLGGMSIEEMLSYLPAV
ncbi:MAG TPA: hypothetical protein DCW68_04895 [Rhodospirillaceae bacterium]|nr:MAG: hypothetical protein A2018_02750 [Alphaproteobacteria bacterium GWF2_58_20]HAU29433.1 hypothetical protein [Rhodospirillaceae bacterium]